MALSNSQYDALMRVYQQRQLDNKRDQDKRIQEVYETVPEVAELSDQIAALMARKQLHRQGADPALLFRRVSDGDGLIRYPFGKPLRQPRGGGSEGAGFGNLRLRSFDHR